MSRRFAVIVVSWQEFAWGADAFANTPVDAEFGPTPHSWPL